MRPRSPHFLFVLIFVMAVACLSPQLSWAAFNIFVRFGDIPGDSVDPDYQGWVDALAFKTSRIRAARSRGVG